jgi:hypothetical protein
MGDREAGRAGSECGIIIERRSGMCPIKSERLEDINLELRELLEILASMSNFELLEYLERMAQNAE